MPTKSRPVNVTAKDEVKATEKLDTYKRWFNGMKHFFTVKVLPPKHK